MAIDARLLADPERRTAARHGDAALGLAGRLPRLVVAARSAAASLMHGVHGRRRAGTGESFWQFRPFVQGESTAAIDWRRSARDDRTYVREREWEAAHTVSIWMDRSPSMAFQSSLASASKVDRALVLGLAAADLLVKGGERVGLLGLMRPMARRTVVEHMAEALILDERDARGTAAAELPAATPLPARARGLLIGDWLSDAADVARTLAALTAEGARGHMIQIADPIEESFPFTGHVEFVDSDGPARLRVGDAASLRARYLERRAAHTAAVRDACRARGWTFAIHRTDRPATEAMLGIAAALADDPGRG